MRPLLAALLLLLPQAAIAQEAPPSGSAVKVYSDTTTNAHGSGVVIEGGLVVTAGHVLHGLWVLQVQTDSGPATQPARVILYDLRNDIAILELARPAGIAVSPLNCRSPVIGEEISTTGNPGPFDFITTWGRVAGSVRAFEQWASVFITDMTVTPGSSGGAVLDNAGEIIGVVVGVMQAPLGGPVGVSVAVPSTVVCRLLNLPATSP